MANGLWLFEKPITKARDQVRRGVKRLASLYEDAPFDAATIEEALAADLAERLLPLVARTLVLELNVARLEGLLEGENGAQRFEYFFEHLRHPRAAQRLLDEYPVLLEQVNNKLTLWADYSVEVLRHVCEDWREIVDTFFTSHPGLLEAVRFGAGDTHRGGRSVVILRFSSGEKLVYKPRSLAVDRHFNELIAWLNERGVEPPLRPVRSLDRGSYGWTEFLRREPCATEEGVRRFYLRQGTYLAILYALEAADFHFENLIAAGECPLPIDLEALFHPRLPEDGVADPLRDSVLKVGLLPARYRGVDMSGLGSAAGQLTPDAAPRWQNAATDEMRLVKQRMAMPGGENRPQCEGVEVDPVEYTAEICNGFERAYRLLLRHRDEALDMARKFVSDPVRVIVRPTRTYALLLLESFHPDVLRDFGDRERLFERLTGMDALRPAEKADLLRGDVPLFTGKPASCDVWTSEGHRIENWFKESGMSLVTRRIEGLSEKDLERQLWIIRASMATLSSLSEGPAIKVGRSMTDRKVEPAELQSEASKIGERLAELAIGNDEVTWAGLVPDDDKNFKLAALGVDLYDGLPGVILFLAHLGALTGATRHTELAKSALKTLQRMLSGQPGMELCCGGFAGWGGLIYCFAQLAALWWDEGLRGEARRIAEKTVEIAESDTYLDVISGVSGLALALRSLNRMEEPARICGERLLATLMKTKEGAGWYQKEISKQPLTGFAHGNAGIGYALLEIAKTTRDGNFAKAARHAFDYERALFSAEQGNWPDLREKRNSDYMLAWCHGAPGIGLSRLGAWRCGEDKLLREEIDTALKTTLQSGFGGNHSLCHGALGNLEVVLFAAGALGDDNWAQRASRLAGGVLDLAKETGWICGNALGVESPGLMTGIAGIGYELLRLSAPERVPSVLVLEKPKRRL